MSADGNVKLAPISPLLIPRNAEIHPKSRQRTCALCERPLHGHPVLLKTGHSLHVECYFLMQKNPAPRRAN
ncbi:MAG TPA: hypothetical protein VMU05_11630 [Dongiaceae bacterium]|nr:hypothetical protein [Dongiaceae bacterium]